MSSDPNKSPNENCNGFPVDPCFEHGMDRFILMNDCQSPGNSSDICTFEEFIQETDTCSSKVNSAENLNRNDESIKEPENSSTNQQSGGEENSMDRDDSMKKGESDFNIQTNAYHIQLPKN